jgi:cytochrome c oxidase subunit I+III
MMKTPSNERADRSSDPLPNALPRPAGELEQLEALWQPPQGWRLLSVVNNTYIGLYYIAAALLFLVLGGALALLMRTQLASSGNALIDADTYNQLFTMHGSVMMFLFAVPVVEAIGVLLLPAMLGARDLPFPRLSAYAFWAYFIGGLIFFSTLFFDLAPDGGWFMYPPLTSWEFSPGLRADFWLLGIGFIEISAIAGAVEIVVGILRTRPPGMTLGKMPVYVWSMLVVGVMIVFAFPPVILATALLELERAFHWPFFVAASGGDPVLWQHLFWLFGHPDVYIIFLPAAGMVSMMIPTMARTPLVGYRPVVLALLATSVISFALWIHHMFATGMPHHATALVSAASLLVAIPTGVQVFAWIATLWRGNVQRAAPTWFLLGFFAVFVLGGLTGVMLALVPYDWQAHDTYFVVAHLHYVMIGGLLFPVFAAVYYWAPLVAGKSLSEAMGKWGCALMFLGVNITFLPMHIIGLAGMPRRVWTYSDALGLDTLNMIATLGAFILAAGIAVVLIDLALHLRVAGKVNTNPWGAGSLEWLPTDNYATRSIPHVSSRDPLWDHPQLREEVESGQHYLPGIATGYQETIVTSAVSANPEYLLRLPGPSWFPIVAGAGTAGFFFLLTVKWFVGATLFAAITLVSIWKWLWELDPPITRKHYDIGAGIRLPDHMCGRRSHSHWGLVVLLCVDAAIFASLAFSYFYLAGGNDAWPPAGMRAPAALPVVMSALTVIGSSAVLLVARQFVLRDGQKSVISIAVIAAFILLCVGMWFHFLSLLDAAIRPDTHAFGAILFAIASWQALHVALLAIMAGFLLARVWTGQIGKNRRNVFDHTALMWHYTVAQGILALGLALALR